MKKRFKKRERSEVIGLHATEVHKRKEKRKKEKKTARACSMKLQSSIMAKC